MPDHLALTGERARHAEERARQVFMQEGMRQCGVAVQAGVAPGDVARLARQQRPVRGCAAQQDGLEADRHGLRGNFANETGADGRVHRIVIDVDDAGGDQRDDHRVPLALPARHRHRRQLDGREQPGSSRHSRQATTSPRCACVGGWAKASQTMWS